MRLLLTPHKKNPNLGVLRFPLKEWIIIITSSGYPLNRKCFKCILCCIWQDQTTSGLETWSTTPPAVYSGRCPTSRNCTRPHGHMGSPSSTIQSTPLSVSLYPGTATSRSIARPTATPPGSSTRTSTPDWTGTDLVSKRDTRPFIRSTNHGTTRTIGHNSRLLFVYVRNSHMWDKIFVRRKRL